METNKEYALYYASLGLSVFPLHTPREDGTCSCNKPTCDKPGKHPRTRNGYKNATNNKEIISAWWDRNPDANIGIPTGRQHGIIVIDVDSDGMKWYQDRKKEFPETWIVRSGGGGQHIYLKWPGFRVSSRVGKISHGVDQRGEGGYVAAPPSLHVSGNLYEWESGPDGIPYIEHNSITGDSPTWLNKMLGEDDSDKTVSERISDNIPEGYRDSTLTSMGGSMVARGFGYDSILQALTLENSQKCKPPLKQSQVKKICDSVTRDEYAPDRFNLMRTTPRMLTVMDREEIEYIEPPEWQVEGIITKQGLSSIYGPPGCGKSFWALDLSMSIASGLPFQGRKTNKGTVMYIAGEGATGLGPRLRAWEKERNNGQMVDSRYFEVMTDAAQLLESEQIVMLLEILENMFEPPSLVVIDTLARSMVGGEENSAKDVGMFVRAADLIKRETEGNVLIVHHSGKDGNIRGSTALMGAVDTMVKMSKDENIITVHNDKQKDFEAFEDQELILDVVQTREFEWSCVLRENVKGEPRSNEPDDDGWPGM